MAIWGAMLGFLLLLFASTEFIQDRQADRIMAERQQATAAALLHINSPPAGNAGAHNERAQGAGHGDHRHRHPRNRVSRRASVRTRS